MSVELSRESLSTREAILSCEFRLNLGDHELIDPTTNRGRVVSIETVHDTTGNRKCDIYDVRVEDPYVEADPTGYMLVSEYIKKMESRLHKDGFELRGERKEATSRREYNEYTSAWIADPSVDGVKLWRDLVPTAEALEYLTNPVIDRIIANRKGEATIVSPETAAQLRFVDDAVAIRDRAVAMQDIAEAHLAELRETQDSVRWLSLASGTAEPAIAAVKAAQDRAASEGQALHAELTVADYDDKSLMYVEQNAERYGFSDQLKPILQNILVDDLKGEIAATTGTEELYDVVENMGFEEYLPQVGDELEAKKGQGLPQASEFTKHAFELVKPGGILISGNMVFDRPQIDYVFGIVDWPLINARSEESILRVYEQAGILDDPHAKVEMFRVKNASTGGHVYNIVKVTKLAA